METFIGSIMVDIAGLIKITVAKLFDVVHIGFFWLFALHYTTIVTFQSKVRDLTIPV